MLWLYWMTWAMSVMKWQRMCLSSNVTQMTASISLVKSTKYVTEMMVPWLWGTSSSIHHLPALQCKAYGYPRSRHITSLLGLVGGSNIQLRPHNHRIPTLPAFCFASMVSATDKNDPPCDTPCRFYQQLKFSFGENFLIPRKVWQTLTVQRCLELFTFPYCSVHNFTIATSGHFHSFILSKFFKTSNPCSVYEILLTNKQNHNTRKKTRIAELRRKLLMRKMKYSRINSATMMVSVQAFGLYFTDKGGQQLRKTMIVTDYITLWSVEKRKRSMMMMNKEMFGVFISW